MSTLKDTVKQLHNFLQLELNSVKQTLITFLNSDVNLINEIQNFLNNHQGKLLRPILTILSAKLFNYSGTNHIKLATAIECIHIATLLHDDVIDNSQIRHNYPTVNLIWDNKSAILMGDYLFSKSFQLMVEIDNIEVLSILSMSSSIIAQGELNQLENIANISLTNEEYFKIINYKTARLFESATHIGALIASKDRNKINILKNVGLNFGLAYQILDDINDYSIEKNIIGKQPGDDLREGKLTLPLILALEKMTGTEKKITQEIIQKPNKTQQDIKNIVTLMNKYSSLIESKKIATDYLLKAEESLNNFKDSAAKVYFINLINSLK